jgi:RNA polymerase sigma factor (sigma-70 family)
VEQLVTRTRSGDQVAALALFTRYEDLVRHQSSRFGRHTTFDYDDARQTSFLAMLTAVEEHADSDKDFTQVFQARIILDLKTEAQRQRFQVVVPLQTFRYVFDTARRFDFDFPAARDFLATRPEVNRRVSRDQFDSVWFWAFSVQIDWSTPAPGTTSTIDETTVDYRATDAFVSIEDIDAVESLLSTLPPVEREVMERWYGLAEFEPQVSDVIGTVLGMNAASIRRIHSRVLAKLLMHSDLPAHRTEVAPTHRDRLRSTAPRIDRHPSPRGPFPVTVTCLREEIAS